MTEPEIDDRDADLVLTVLDSDDLDLAATPPDGPPELVHELMRVRTIMGAFGALGVSSDTAPPPLPAWGPFTLLEQVGRGRFGTVCRGFDPAVQREVAVKLYSGKELPSEPRLMARVRHPNVVTVFGAAVHEGRPGIWMEFVRGRTLGDRVQSDGPLSPDEVLRIGLALCDALGAVHGAQLIHQDVKPRNVMQEDNGRVVLMDFGAGLSHDAAEDPERFSGTPVYMAPEVVLGQRPSVESDVYSLGVLLYYLLTGTYPVYAPDLAELRRLHERHHRAGTRRFVAALHELRPGVSPVLAKALARALAPAGQRYRTAGEFAAALDEVKHGPWRSTPSRTALWSSLGCAAVIGAASLLWLRPSAEPPSPTLRRLTWEDGLTLDPALSRDGKLLAYASDRADGNLDVWVQQTSGGEPLRLTRDPGEESQPSFTPDGSSIVYRSDAGLHVVSALGGTPRRVADRGHAPRYSPDGRWLGYADFRSLVLVPVSAGEMRRLDLPGNVLGGPVWSPDSRRVLVLTDGARLSGEDWEWWLISIDSGALQALGARALFPSYSVAMAGWWPSPWSWHEDRLLFDAPHGDTTNLWEVTLRDGRLRGRPRRLLTSTEGQFQPLRASADRLVFATRTARSYLAEVALGGPAPAVPRFLVPYAMSSGVHSISRDGRWLAYVSSRLGDPAVWLHDMTTGSERLLAATSGHQGFPVMRPDGAVVYYSVRKGQTTSVYSVPSAGGLPAKVCDDCGPVTDVSADGRTIVLQTGASEHASLELLDADTGRRSELLKDAEHMVYRGHLSADGRWIVFHTWRPQGTREFIAPFRGAQPIAFADWIPVNDGRARSDAPRWSADGNTVYYISDRDGFRCVWAQALHADTRKPKGEPRALVHLHSRRQSMANVNPLSIELSVGPDRLIFNVGELSGSLWAAEPDRSAGLTWPSGGVR
jgi:serine/threonine protein kinase